MTTEWKPKKLRPRHSEVIRLCHEGMTNIKIGELVGMSAVAVSLVLRSPLAQAELARLKHAADLRAIDTPLRAREALEIDRAALDSLRFNADLVRDPLVDKKLRAKVATHFLDRVVFDKSPAENEGSYREILRSLNEIERQMSDRPIPVVIEAKREEVVNHGKAPQETNVSERHASEEGEVTEPLEFVKLKDVKAELARRREL
jgi:hypothetical protein